VTWEPKELQYTLPNLLECIQDFEARKDEPDLFLPTADQTLDNLEREGFDMSNRAKIQLGLTVRTAGIRLDQTSCQGAFADGFHDEPAGKIMAVSDHTRGDCMLTS